ncbi:MAG: NAD(P)H-hydrate epimerase, partial [Candidatus Omnitrophota bacterium]|nr:NAD(P)H-hydrate epimerase [Candidatus Omnitrophota bacterium]
RYAIEDCGISAGSLMERAGKAVAEEVCKIYDKNKGRKGIDKGSVLIFCGYGNNGGDGLAAARHLFKNGYKVKVFFVGKPKSLSPETNSNLESLLTINIHPLFISNESDIENILGKIAKPDVVTDAIFGIGIKGSLDNFYVKLIDKINEIGAPIVSVDIPSGMDTDSGNPSPVAIKAASTVTFGYPKAGFKNAQADKFIGQLIVADIGFSDTAKARSLAKNKTIRLRTGKSGVVRSGHPWIFRSQISKPASGIKPGDIVAIQNADGKFIGRGYYNPKSEISVRLLSFDDEVIDQDFFRKRFKEALQKRDGLKAITNAYRAIFSEADKLPGLIVDMYKDTAVFQVLTLGMEKLKPIALEAMREALKPLYIYEKSESPFRKIEGLKDVKTWHGDKGETMIEIFEGKAKFLVDIENGHKTGFYLDQRKSRLGLEGFCRDKTVLDLFCYTGGFLVNAGLYGARSVEGVDIKEDWLKLARENTRLNGILEKSEFVKGDAFSVLKAIFDSGRRFGVIILDPPSFLRSRESLASASKGYKELNTLAMKTLSDAGMLATFSCSHNMPGAAFSEILKKSAIDAGKSITILKRCHQAEDHPIVRTIPETEYLKGYFLKISDR